MSGHFSFIVSRGNNDIALETPRPLFLLIWDNHWGIFLPDRHSSSSSGKIWHKTTSSGAVVAKSTKSTTPMRLRVCSIPSPRRSSRNSRQTFVVEVIRELESRGHATREAVDFVRRQSLASVRVTTWNRERRHPLPDLALNNLGPRAPRVDFSSTDSTRGVYRGSSRGPNSSGSGSRAGSDTHRRIEEMNPNRRERNRAEVHSDVNIGHRPARATNPARATPHRGHAREVASRGTEVGMPGGWVD
ncbi:hypothetical protein P171DRAFT_441800 [Karstenula rhodostoma CBS 690.94]|uniref:Uncharacterized protein n=1 Tax=Karstenula rhodostoma CBS 690.94 TaxID=1392251 RepID=A0A9P4PMM3_9PLEO|nr:hypothetical protein P171DRAFT_441800 [Karstenula rhodostoma CBS 690.94]